MNSDVLTGDVGGGVEDVKAFISTKPDESSTVGLR